MKPGEYGKVALAFAAFFLLLFGYYILRPVRDEMGVQTGVEKLQWLFTGTFLFTLLIVPGFGWAAKRIPRAYLLPVVYGFIIANLIGCLIAFAAGITKYSAGAFFIWLSVFNLFMVSLFWSRVNDTFSTEQSHRLYGYIAAGGTVGALAGPALTASLARHVSTAYLLGIAALALAGSTACKAKNFIDTTVYRANDAASSWIVSALRASGLNAIFLAGLPAAALWFFTGYRLGGRHDRDIGMDGNNGNDKT